MPKKIAIISCLLIVFTVYQSCKDDDDAYVPLNIQVNLDTVQMLQGTSIDISIFTNDVNIPENGTLETSIPNNGSLSIQNTESNLNQSYIKYTPNSDFYGDDSFQYTVCQNDNCATAEVTITVSPVSQVNFNLEAFPYDTLSEYNFYTGIMSDLNPEYGVLPYGLNSALFSDYAKKKRFVWKELLL